MNTAEKKEFLMHIVEDADEKLTGLLIAIANEYNASGEQYSKEETAEFYKIRDSLLADPQSGYTPELAHDIIAIEEMDYELVLSNKALAETDDAYNYYEDQSPGLGDRFIESIGEAYKKLSQSL